MVPGGSELKTNSTATQKEVGPKRKDHFPLDKEPGPKDPSGERTPTSIQAIN